MSSQAGSSSKNIIKNDISSQNTVQSVSELPSFSTFLWQYEYQIRRLYFYYKQRRFDNLRPVDNFFYLNGLLFFFLLGNLDEIDDFIETYQTKHETDRNRISTSWRIFKKFLLNGLYAKTSQNQPILKNGFKKFLMCLINQNMAYQNGYKDFNLGESLRQEKKQARSIKEFAKALVVFVLDMPEHVLILDDEYPIIQLKIFLMGIRWGLYDHEVVYSLSLKDYDISSNTPLNVNEESSIKSKKASKLTDSDNTFLIRKPDERQEKSIDFLDKELKASLKSTKSDEIENLINSCKFEILQEETRFDKYYSKIRSQFPFTNIAALYNCSSVVKLKKTSFWLTVLKIVFSFWSMLDIIFDILLALQFFKSNQPLYGSFTILILILVGSNNILIERQFLDRINLQTNYLPNRLNCPTLRYICSFLQLSSFLSKFKVAIMSFEARKEKQVETLLKALCQDNIAALQGVGQYLKHIEGHLEAFPQMLLQIYIILTTKQWVNLQVLSISIRLVNINWTNMTFEAIFEKINSIDIWRYPVVFLTTISYNGLLITSLSLLFWQFHWIFSVAWIGLHIFLTYFSRMNKSDKTLIFINHNLKKINYLTIFNYTTVFDTIILSCILIFKLIDQLQDSVFVGLFISQVIFSLIWTLLMVRREFYFMTNLMYIPLFVRDINS